uniref:Uncharacterized protein n=1 Tax=Arundo donax TaxID=35708 RepID=A0A0A9CKJ8_ARUDO
MKCQVLEDLYKSNGLRDHKWISEWHKQIKKQQFKQGREEQSH